MSGKVTVIRAGWLVGVVVLCAWWPGAAWGQCEFQKLTASDAAAGDFFGSVAISGDYLIVGASGDDDACPADPNCNSGAAYVFHRDDNGTPNDGSDDTWVEQAKLTASDAEPGDGFGSPVDIDGDLALIGSPGDDDACPLDPGCDSGSAYIFRREGTNWVQEGKLTASNAASLERLGMTLSISGELAIVSSLFRGQPCVFRRESTTWVQEARLATSDPELAGNFGQAVALDGTLALVGAPGDYDEFHASPGGAVYVFRREGTTWTEGAKLIPNDPANGDSFGESVAIDGEFALVGTLNFPTPPVTTPLGKASMFAGSAYVFRREGTIWEQEARLRPSDGQVGESFGIAVSIRGSTAIVGAWMHDSAGTDAGATYLFSRSSGNWLEKAKLIPKDAATSDFFGSVVGIDESFAVGGALLGDDACTNDSECDSGAAYIYWLNAAPDCVPIPTVGTWGLVILVLLFATAATASIKKRKRIVRFGCLLSVLGFALYSHDAAFADELIPRPRL